MSAIASTATSSQYFQAAQPLAKADATKASASTTAQQTLTANAAPTGKPVVESSTTKNSDGTFGPKHLRVKPGTLPSAQPQTSGSVSTVDLHA